MIRSAKQVGNGHSFPKKLKEGKKKREERCKMSRVVMTTVHFCKRQSYLESSIGREYKDVLLLLISLDSFAYIRLIKLGSILRIQEYRCVHCIFMDHELLCISCIPSEWLPHQMDMVSNEILHFLCFFLGTIGKCGFRYVWV